MADKNWILLDNESRMAIICCLVHRFLPAGEFLLCIAKRVQWPVINCFTAKFIARISMADNRYKPFVSFRSWSLPRIGTAFSPEKIPLYYIYHPQHDDCLPVSFLCGEQ